MRGNSILAGLLVLLSVGAATAHAEQRALGIDVSAWQGSMSQSTWNGIHNVDNRDFVFIRASRGGTTGVHPSGGPGGGGAPSTLSQRYDDPYFIQNITRATNAGLLAGAYHFSRPDVIETTQNSGGIANTGTDEANHFLQMAGPWMRPGYLMPTHDLEAGDQIRSDPEIAQFTLDFSDRIYEVMGIRPAIYLNGNYARYVLGGASSSQQAEILAKHPNLWIARWPNGSGNEFTGNLQTALPDDSLSWLYGIWDDNFNNNNLQPWHFWQYSSGEHLSSFGPRLDADVANGGIEFLKDHLIPALWMNDSSGDWNTLANWNSGQVPVAPVQGPGQAARVGAMTLPTPRLPGADDVARNVDGQNDTVILDRPGANITVTLSSGTHNIRKLYAREELVVTGGSLIVNYVPSPDSTPFSAEFSAAVSLSGGASLSVHTLAVDAAQTFTVGDASLQFKAIDLDVGSPPAKLLLSGDVNVSGLDGATATIANGPGRGGSGVVDLGAASRTFNVADGAASVDLAIDVPVVDGGLVKAGAGTLALGGANAYTGDTAVDAGTLRLAAATLADAADLFLATGATIDLAFSPTLPDVIDSLFVDGVSQPAGLWGAIGSGAQFTTSLITGSGLLQVTTFEAPMPGDFNGDRLVDSTDLGIWSANFGTATGANVSMGDADADGDVDGGDLLVWQQGQGAAGAPAAAVPEPATAALALLAAAALSASCARRMPRR